MVIIPASNPLRFDPPTFQLPPQVIDHYITPPHYDLTFHADSMCVKLLREHSEKQLNSVQGECVCLYGWLCSRHSAGWLNSRLVMQQISG